MTSEKIKKILDLHYITWAAGPAGKIYALETWKDTKTGLFECELTDVTGWSKKKLYDWLGY